MKIAENISKKTTGNLTMRLLYLITAMVFILSSGGLAFSDDSPSISQYTAYPPFGGRLIKPNVLLNLDTSQSLYYFAYDYNYNTRTITGGKNDVPASVGFDPAGTQYYGYFNPDKWYKYLSGEFQPVGDKSDGRPASTWDGNFLNWLTMRRADIVRKALIGGKTKQRVGITTPAGHPNDLIGQAAHFWSQGFEKKLGVTEDNFLIPADYTPCDGSSLTFTFDNTGMKQVAVTDIAYFSVSGSSNCSETYYVISHPIPHSEPKGVIQRVGNSVRWGLEFIDDGTPDEDDPARDACNGETGNSNSPDPIEVAGGTVVVPVGYNKVNDIVSRIANKLTDTPATPLAESLWTATGYFRQESALGNTFGRYTSNSYPVEDEVTDDIPVDPYNYGISVSDPKTVGCGKSFVITITDGEPTADLDIPSPPVAYNEAYTDGAVSVPGWADDTSTDPVTGSLINYFWHENLKGSHYIDDVALWSHAEKDTSYRDLRRDITTDLDGNGIEDKDETQYLTHYFIHATLGGSGTPDGRRLLNWPNTGPVSPNPGDDPGHENAGGAARNGGFEESGTNYIPDVTGEYDSDGDGNNDNFNEAKTGDELEAALIKALFKIIKQSASGTSPAFAGSRNGQGSIIYQAYFYPEKTFHEGKRSWLGYLQALEVDSDGNVSDTPLWEAGEKLWERDLSTLPRLVYTTTDGTNLIEFRDGNGLDDYLRAADTSEAANIISYIQGVDIPGYRSRTINGNVWKLGDIIYSSPTPVGTPGENYDRLYKDSSYTNFYRTYKDRRTVVYAGANDGMLHAFNGGKYNALTGKYETGGTYPPIGKELALGDELWGFIPKQLLPHLKWLTDPNYTHVYYVDLKPKVTDVQIFCDDTNSSADCINGQSNVTHPGGWGTILIGGMRLGGKQISTEINGKNETFYPAYFALDITDPESLPKLLWTFTDQDSDADGVPDLGIGLTMSYPAIARVNTDAKDLWVMIAGSGPTDFDAGSNVSSNLTGKVFVVDLTTGSLLKSFDTGVSNAFMTDPIAVDVNLDYKVDVAYIGEAYDPGTGYTQLSGNMYRLVTKNSTDVFNEWKLSTLISTSGYKPVTAAPSAALDGKGNMWVFFGTGKFVGSDDKVSTDAQAFYGIKEICQPWKDYTCTTGVPETDLLDVSSVKVDVGATNITATTISGSTCGDTATIEWCDLLNAINTKDGWVIKFPTVPGHESLKGERSFIKPVVLGGLVIFTSYIPEEDICSNSQGDGYIWAVYYETGTAYKNYVFTDEITGEPATVGRELQLGEGFASISATVTRGGSLKTLAQTSLGNIPGIEMKTPFSLQSGIVAFKTGVCQE